MTRSIQHAYFSSGHQDPEFCWCLQSTEHDSSTERSRVSITSLGDFGQWIFTHSPSTEREITPRGRIEEEVISKFHVCTYVHRSSHHPSFYMRDHPIPTGQYISIINTHSHLPPSIKLQSPHIVRLSASKKPMKIPSSLLSHHNYPPTQQHTSPGAS